MNRRITHVGFSDESNWNVGQFRSLALVTLQRQHIDKFNKDLKCLLAESQVKEFKWKELKGAREKFTALRICDFVIKHVLSKILRVDVLIWDIQDERHNIQGRDDIANLQRMYYHLFLNVMRKRWPDDAVWRLYPDEHTAMDWQTIQDCLEAVSVRPKIEHSLFTGGEFSFRLQQEFGIEEIVYVKSHDYPLLQIADLFAGLAVFSREKFDKYQQWLHVSLGQKSLFEEPKFSRRDRTRFFVLKNFNRLCKQYRLGVSLKNKRGLWTPNPNNPLNFWHYKPQHPEDKAPIKEGRIGSG